MNLYCKYYRKIVGIEKKKKKNMSKQKDIGKLSQVKELLHRQMTKNGLDLQKSKTKRF